MNMNALKLNEEGSMISSEQLQRIKNYMNTRGLTHIRLLYLTIYKTYPSLQEQDINENNPKYSLLRRELSVAFTGLYRFAGSSYSHQTLIRNSYTSIHKELLEEIELNKKSKTHTLIIITDPHLLNIITLDYVNYILV